jgi:hypothetical protein
MLSLKSGDGSMKLFAVVMLSLTMLSGCASLPTVLGVVTVKSVCTVWTPLTYSKKDTPVTQHEIVVNNERREGFCS